MRQSKQSKRPVCKVHKNRDGRYYRDGNYYCSKGCFKRELNGEDNK